MSDQVFTAERLAARLARADYPEALEPIWHLLIHAAHQRAFGMLAFWDLWDCLTTLYRALPWTANTDPARIEQARHRGHTPACELQANDRVVVRAEPGVVWTLAHQPVLLADEPVIPVAVLRFTAGQCLTVPDDHPFLVINQPRTTTRAHGAGHV